MRVTVLLAGVLRPAADGAARLDVEVTEGADLGAVLDLLAARYPLLGRRLRTSSGGCAATSTCTSTVRSAVGLTVREPR